MARKLSAIRQLSLQCETPPPSSASRRASLKKQHSEEIHEDGIGIRISLSAKALNRNPNNIKVAWGECEEDNNRLGLGKTTTTRRHSHCSEQVKDNILYSRQDLAVKLRQAWQEREKTNKLNIFLAHNVTCSNLDQNVPEFDVQPTPNEPKIILPLMHPEIQENANLKNIFQKHLRKSSKIHSPSAGSDSETATAIGNHTNAVVVVPIIERSSKSARTDFEHAVVNDSDEMKYPAEFVKNDKPRPSTAAAQKRAIFQKRTNSAFQNICQPSNSTNRQFRPPLVRASSLPTTNSKSESPKPKFLRKKVKANSKRSKTSKDPNDPEKDEHHRNKNTDVITMVSLLSPSESEPEECESIKEQTAPAKQSPKKSIPWKKDESKHFSLRKTVKQVSFQQSSIHAVRSFSASFPARRASVATNLLLDNAVKKLQKNLEKRGQLDEGQIDAKRRLLRSTTISGYEMQTNPERSSHQHQPSSQSLSNATVDLVENRNIQKDTPHQDQTNLMTTNDDEDADDECKRTVISVVPKKSEADEIESAKEKKCWETYCRMKKSGLTVSFDTILRGMLTPTEYRLRRKLSIERSQLQANETNEETTTAGRERAEG